MTIFKSEKEICDFIKKQGLFINEDDLCIKTSETEFERLQNICIDGEMIPAKTRLNEFIRFNSYPFINLVNITIPEIDISIINQYHNRNKRIEDNKTIKDEVKDASNILNKRHFRLVKFSKVKPNEEHYWIFNTKTNSLSAYDNTLLSASEKNKAIEYPNKLFFQRAIEDNCKNQYEDLFKIENKKFQDIKINDELWINRPEN